jgi:hypothetical protein
MIKRTLIVMALVALLIPAVKAAVVIDETTYAPYSTYFFSDGQSDDEALKVDGSKKFYWPVDFKWLEVCRIPIKMKVGMIVRVTDCDHSDKKLIMVQKDCADIGQGNDKWPCYYGCVTVGVTANFPAEIRGRVVNRNEAVFPDSGKIGYSDPVVIDGDGNKHNVEICVKAWEVKIEKIAAGDEVNVAELSIQARPAVM